MAINDHAYIVGAYEHPLRHAPDHSVARLHAEVAKGAVEDAGLSKDDIDGFFCAGDAPGANPWSLANYLNLRKLKYLDSTDMGGCSYLIHVAHAAQAIAAGRCNVALITLAGRPRSEGISGTQVRVRGANLPESPYEMPYRPVTLNLYAMCAMRHMYEFGTTPEQLAWVKVAASRHAWHNPNAVLRKPVSVEEVLASPLISDPLHRLDSCVVTDGGGAIVVARAEVAAQLHRPRIRIKGYGETTKHQDAGKIDLTYTGQAWSGPRAFEAAGVGPGDIQYASIYDSFTITVLLQLEDLGFCKKGEGGRFVQDGNLVAGIGRMPVNTDGGGLCNNHPSNRGGMTKIIEAVRQLRGEAHPELQVPGCALALASGIGGAIGHRHGAATLIMEREA